jgi:hypothetical protein
MHHVFFHIVYLEQIRAWACECDSDIRSHYREYLNPTRARDENHRRRTHRYGVDQSL